MVYYPFDTKSAAMVVQRHKSQLIEQTVTSLRQSRIYTRLATRVKSWFPTLYLTPPAQHIPSLKQWITENAHQQERPRGVYIPIYPAQSVEMPPPRSIYPEPHPEFCQRYECPEAFVADLEDVYVIGPDGYVVSSDRQLFIESTWGPEFIAEQAYQLRRPYLKRLQHKRGVYAILAMPWSDWYYHWFLDTLPRLALLEAVGEASQPLIVSRFGGSMKRYREESLELLGFPSSHWVYLDDQHWHVERLIFPSCPGVSGEPPSWAVEWLRNKFLGGLQPKGGRRLYISRRGAAHRRVINEQEIIDYLQAFSFDIVQPELLPVTEQVHMFASASVIVSPHGAGLTNMLFAKNAVVVELFAPGWINPCYYHLANQLHHEYWYVVGESASQTASLKGEGYGDLVVPLEALSQTLHHALQSL